MEKDCEAAVKRLRTETMEAAQGVQKVCPTEDAPEVKVTTDWAPLLEARPPSTALRRIEDEARAHYSEHKLLQLERLLNEAECARLNQAAEDVGFGRTNYPQSYRGNLRLIVEDRGLAAMLWERIRPFVPEILPVNGVDDDGDDVGVPSVPTVWRACGLNECFRLAKYYPGHRFGAHCDANFYRSDGEMSFYTVNVYLNAVDAAHGGHTRFYTDRNTIDLSVQPEPGLAVLFLQPPRAMLRHDGDELRSGVKYLLRTDVMYRRERHVAGGGAPVPVA